VAGDQVKLFADGRERREVKLWLFAGSRPPLANVALQTFGLPLNQRTIDCERFRRSLHITDIVRIISVPAIIEIVAA